MLIAHKTCNKFKYQLSHSLDSSAQEENRSYLGSGVRFLKKYFNNVQTQRDIVGLGNTTDQQTTRDIIEKLRIKIENGLSFDDKDFEQLFIRQYYATKLAVELNARLITFNNKPQKTHTSSSVKQAIQDINDSHGLRKITHLCLSSILEKTLALTTKKTRELIKNALLDGAFAEVRFDLWPKKSTESLKTDASFLPDSDDEA